MVHCRNLEEKRISFFFYLSYDQMLYLALDTKDKIILCTQRLKQKRFHCLSDGLLFVSTTKTRRIFLNCYQSSRKQENKVILKMKSEDKTIYFCSVHRDLNLVTKFLFGEIEIIFLLPQV